MASRSQTTRWCDSGRSEQLPITQPRCRAPATICIVMNPGGSPTSSVPSMSKLTSVTIAAGTALSTLEHRLDRQEAAFVAVALARAGDRVERLAHDDALDAVGRHRA